MAYVDTNILIAAYTPNDPMHEPARNFLKSATIPTIISVLTFTELVSVLARNEQELETPDSLRRESSKRRIRAIAEYIIQDSGVVLASQVGTSKIRLGGKNVVIPLEYAGAASLAATLKLRTLDLIHLAYAHLIGRLEYSVESFVTADAAIASRANQIRELLGLKVKSPTDAMEKTASTIL